MKLIFVKSTGEHFYLDVYVRLCTIMFKKFDDKENYELNFKKLMVSKCQKQFFKMLSKERDERKKRKDSANLADEVNAANEKDEEEDRSKLMMHLYDDQEMLHRKKEQMYGNMYLITELFIAK
jgi:hypothetical protein